MNLHEKKQILEDEYYRLCQKFDVTPYAFTVGKLRLHVRGTCRYYSKTIAISEQYLEVNEPESMFSTLRHEFAHQIAAEVFGEYDGHRGRRFRETCEILGCSARARTADEGLTRPIVNTKYTVLCQCCEWERPAVRMSAHKKLGLTSGWYRCPNCRSHKLKVEQHF